jgi:acyl carrier protein
VGLDSVQIILTVEEQFGIKISDAEAERLIRVSDLHRCIAKKLQGRASVGDAGRGWSDEEILEEIRRIVAEEIGLPRERITWDARLHADLDID